MSILLLEASNIEKHFADVKIFDIKKPAGVLSGGERVKLGLAKMLVSHCNMYRNFGCSR